MEVLAYESVKWIRRLRGGQPKLLAITAGEGHFAKGTSATRQRAEDMAILDSLMRKKSNPRIYKMLGNTRRNRRNNLTARKNRRNNVTARKNRRNNVVGGKRGRKHRSRKY
jgi:hypothetical protein